MNKSDVRIVTSINGFNMLKQFVNSYINKNMNNDSLKNLLEQCDLQYRSDRQCYFGWNGYNNWGNYLNKSAEVIMEGLRFLEQNDYSYRFYRIGDDKEDYDEHHFDSTKEGEQDLEYPNITREFDDRYMCDILHTQKYRMLDENKEEIDI